MRKLLDPEVAHIVSIAFSAKGICPKDTDKDPPILSQTVLGHKFSNPIGLAAGYDKDGEAVGSLMNLGFSFVEIGTVTPTPQPGNDKPRMFRLPEDLGTINRYGFNSAGMDVVGENLRRFQVFRNSYRKGLVGVNAGKNKVTEGEFAVQEDYASVFRSLGPYADYLVVNVSSPNTPGLRALQRGDALIPLLDSCRAQRDKILEQNRDPSRPLPILLKIDPDLDDEQLKDIADIMLKGGADGIIVSNTTLTRPASLVSQHKLESGGLSGRPLKDRSTALIAEIYHYIRFHYALEKIEAGASLVQMYTMLAYEGPGAVRRTKRELHSLLKAKGYKSVSEAVGKANK
eukprot:gene2678-5271_t